MYDETPRLKLPLLRAGQMQKEITHNEALIVLDGLVAPAVTGISAAPPALPNDGDIWLIAANAQADWAGCDDQLAISISGGWRFVQPREGMQVWNMADTRTMRFTGGRWRASATGLTSTRAVASAAGGAVQDAELRSCVAALIAALQEVKIIG